MAFRVLNKSEQELEIMLPNGSKLFFAPKFDKKYRDLNPTTLATLKCYEHWGLFVYYFEIPTKKNK